MSIKKLLKAILPSSFLMQLARASTAFTKSKYEGMSTQETFTHIYRNGVWGKSKDSSQPFFSGTGSHNDHIVSTYVSSVRDFLKSLPSEPNVVDLGCGDFAVGSQIRPFCGVYIACDIVEELIEHNRDRYSHLNVDFRTLDLSVDPLPAANILFIRQVLQHLSNAHILRALPEIAKKYQHIIITEHLPSNPNFKPNIDKPAGHGIRLNLQSGVDLAKPPFSLTSMSEKVLCEVAESGGLIRTTLYTLTPNSSNDIRNKQQDNRSSNLDIVEPVPKIVASSGL